MWLGLSLAALAGAGSAAQAQNPTPTGLPEGWTSDIGFYFWLPDLTGPVTIRNLSVEADADFGDLSDSIESMFAMHFEAMNRDSVGGFFDISWMNFEEEPEFPGGGEGKLDAAIGFVEVGMAARTKRGASFFDVLVGFRWVRFESALESPSGQDEENAKNYFDPMIGVRVGAELAEWLQVSFRFDAAGFGVGTEMCGNLVMQASFHVSPTVDLVAGWRSMSIKIDEDRYDLDVLLSGPFFAFNFGM
jgi:hypothetical protein